MKTKFHKIQHSMKNVLDKDKPRHWMQT